MKPVEKGLGRLEGVVESEGVVRFRIALGKSEKSEVSVLTKIYALAMQKYQENDRKPYGPGWALVGDASYHKDPHLAQGITDAFRDAELLTEAADAGLSGRRPLDEALADYEEKRNAAAMPAYELNCQLASLEPPPPEMQQLFAALRGNQAETDRFFGTLSGTVPVQEFFAPENVQRILSAA